MLRLFGFEESYSPCIIHYFEENMLRNLFVHRFLSGLLDSCFSCLQFYGKEAWIAYTASTVKTSVVILSFGLVEPFQPNEMFIYV